MLSTLLPARCCQHSAAGPWQGVTLITGSKQQSLSIAGDDNEMFMARRLNGHTQSITRPQRQQSYLSLPIAWFVCTFCPFYAFATLVWLEACFLSVHLYVVCYQTCERNIWKQRINIAANWYKWSMGQVHVIDMLKKYHLSLLQLVKGV